MEQLRYIVTLKSKDDLEAFYHDIECENNISLVTCNKLTINF